MKKYINIALSMLALTAVVALVAAHFEYKGAQTILFALISLCLGYFFGKWTCHLQKRQSGFWITLLVFVVLNLLHSLIDGASIGDITFFSEAAALSSHELARQPTLYIVLWGMLTPFMVERQYRFLIVPIAVTGVWLLGTYLGYELFIHANQVSWIEPIADQAVFLFLGDIIHHIYDEYRKLRKTRAVTP